MCRAGFGKIVVKFVVVFFCTLNSIVPPHFVSHSPCSSCLAASLTLVLPPSRLLISSFGIALISLDPDHHLWPDHPPELPPLDSFVSGFLNKRLCSRILGSAFSILAVRQKKINNFLSSRSYSLIKVSVHYIIDFGIIDWLSFFIVSSFIYSSMISADLISSSFNCSCHATSLPSICIHYGSENIFFLKACKYFWIYFKKLFIYHLGRCHLHSVTFSVTLLLLIVS